MRGFFAFVCLTLAALGARAAEPRADESGGLTLRMAAIAPDGTGWAREVRAFSREIEAATHNAVHVKWYLGGIAGDEPAALDRIRRGQLDGAAGALFCGSLAPTMTVTRVAGLVQTRAEALHLLYRLRPRIDEEFKKNGFVALALGDFGNDILLLRNKPDSFADLKRTRLWMWNADTLARKQLGAMGMTMVPAAVPDLAGMYDAGQIDGMFVIPTAALAYQWTTRAHYFLPLHSTALAACVVMSQRAFDQLSFEQQQVVQAAGARLGMRFEALGVREDDLLLNTVFERQGIKRLPAAEALRAAFLDVATRTRDQVAPLLPADVLRQATTILEDFRAGKHDKH